MSMTLMISYNNEHYIQMKKFYGYVDGENLKGARYLENIFNVECNPDFCYE